MTATGAPRFMRRPARRVALVLALLLAASACVRAAPSIAARPLSAVPNPMTSPALCGRPHVQHSAVCDPDSLLSEESRDAVEGYINDITKAQVAVAVIAKMDLASVSTANAATAAERYARGLHDAWRVGMADTNNGALLFLSTLDRKVFISVGAGVQARLTSSSLDDIITLMKPYLKDGQYGPAVTNAVVQIGLVVDGRQKPRTWASVISDNFFFVAAVGLIAWVVLSAHFSQRSIDRLERGRAEVGRLMRAVDVDPEGQAGGDDAGVGGGGGQFMSETCPICLDDFPRVYPSTSGSPSANASPGSGALAPMALRCGHVFCKQCLTNHIRQSSGQCLCPICRSPVDADDVSPSRSSSTSSWSWEGCWECCGRWLSRPGPSYRSYEMMPLLSVHRHHQCRRQEVAFRLHRLHDLYPEVLSSSQLMSLTAAVQHGESARLVSELSTRQRELQTQSIELRKRSEQRATASGSRGSTSSSFGGGRSSGGRGGSW